MGVELDFSWPVFKQYAFYTSILIFKVISISFLTVALQYKKRIVFMKEDRKFLKTFRLVSYDEDIERTHRTQQDDLKTIIPFCILGFIYCFTHPSPQYARTLFQIFTVARFVYSFVCVIYIIRQPSRAIAWSVATVINLYMCFKIFFYFMG
ncbi:unnamed protein product [Orchesella dallaii]|uniref:Microsomal glutathione S-transferase 1 n=1 Tax=Orchesella dallaii TaxID=48710 RepID=A0ABP1RN77_9HEXA